ncbi:hypothetical protein BH09PAT4_BH09PAT4_09010 [soil metagenome]
MLHRYEFDHRYCNPAVAITWSTQGVFTQPGEMFDAGSGYFVDPEQDCRCITKDIVIVKTNGHKVPPGFI